MPAFATYLHPHSFYTSKPANTLQFIGHSYPHFNKIRQILASELDSYPSLAPHQVEIELFKSVHTETYLSALQSMAAGKDVAEKPRLSPECRNLEFCLPGYQYGLGGFVKAIDEMKKGGLDGAYTFALGGHHAYSDWGHGYCLLNSQAAAARYAQSVGFQRVLIIDWDIHHGDGTQTIFANDPSVYCISIHSINDLYMAFQRVMKLGKFEYGRSIGHCNIPLLHAIYDDEFVAKSSLETTYYRAHESIAAFEEALTRLPWSPDIIFIFSGYDGHIDDCGSEITDWTNEDFIKLTKLVLNLARNVSVPVLSTHGGGYKTDVTVAAALAHVHTLATY